MHTLPLAARDVELSIQGVNTGYYIREPHTAIYHSLRAEASTIIRIVKFERVCLE